MRIFVCIKSYNRPRPLLNLLQDLGRESVGHPVHLTVYDDGSDRSMALPKRFALQRFGAGTWWSKYHLGKRGAWQLHNRMYADLARWIKKDDVVFFFDDDMRLCTKFFDRALALWGQIPDPKKATLHLMKDSSRQHTTCWTGVNPTKVTPEIRKIQWVDGTFMADRAMLEAIDWELAEIPVSRWDGDPGRSTGVGEQLSLRLHGLGMGLYQVDRSLVVHIEAPSKYNATERKRIALGTVDFVDGDEERKRLLRSQRVEASLASIPSRVACLTEVVKALLPQVDVLRCYLNGYDEVPAFLDDQRIVVERSQVHGDLGDRGKFFWCEEPDGVQLICDDDIFYPPDYVARMLRALDQHGRRAVVGLHGVKLREPFAEYYRDRVVSHFGLGLARDIPQDILGTGCLAYDPVTIAVERSDFREPNMADIWFGLLAQREGVPLVAISRRKGWLKPQPNAEDSIYGREDVAARASAVLREAWPWKKRPEAPPFPKPREEIPHHPRCHGKRPARACRCQRWRK